MLGATLCRLRFNMYCIYDRNLQHVNQWKPSWFMSTLSIRLQDVAARSLSQAMGSESMNIYHPQWFRFIHSSTPDLKDFTMDTPICLPDFPAGGTWNGHLPLLATGRKVAASSTDCSWVESIRWRVAKDHRYTRGPQGIGFKLQMVSVLLARR